MVKISNKGGCRPGAGRPHGSGRYREGTRPIRIPTSLVPQVKLLLAKKSILPELNNFDHHYKASNNDSLQAVPLYSFRVAAGLPTYVDDYVESYLNFNEYFIQNPRTTFCVRVEGSSMIGAGIHENDILVVDNAIEPIDGKIVIACLNSELTVKRLKLRQGKMQLIPENPAYSTIKITSEMDFKILGVAVHVIHSI
jgi:DNA polymerase V